MKIDACEVTPRPTPAQYKLFPFNVRYARGKADYSLGGGLDIYILSI